MHYTVTLTRPAKRGTLSHRMGGRAVSPLTAAKFMLRCGA